MPLEPGTRFGPYEIVAPLGAGGMGEVYKARDTRLDRSVAIKVLPSHIAQREDLRARFEREARAVSSLNHPNICSLFDVGRQDGVEFMVMEHLEGETLADRIARGPLPLEDALKYCMQIAEAVDRAHRSGVVHRDLKPANVMITRDGAKVLDFGLAKTAASKAVAAGDATLTQALTSEGTVLGTPQYMSPEQIEGREADTRSDIFAFGCLLYEGVTGKRAFDGKTRASVIGAILSAEPPSIAGIAPPRLDTIVKQCLVKDPEQRYQSLWDVLIDLRTLGDGNVLPPSRSRRSWIPWAVAGVLAVALAATIATRGRVTLPAPTSVRFHIDPPEATTLGPVISPDGRTIAVVAQQKLWIRDIESLEFKVVEGAVSPTYPFWSPDSKSLGYFSQSKLMKIAPGGSPVTLCDVDEPRGGTWNREGVILFGFANSKGIHRVSASGGTPTPVTTVDKKGAGDEHRYPHFLPDGRRFLFTYLAGDKERAGIYVGSMDGASSKRIRPESSAAVYAPGIDGSGLGRILYRRNRTVVAQPFDSESLNATGDVTPLVEEIGVSGNTGSGAFSVSGTGALVYRAGTPAQELVWQDRTGKRIGVQFEATADSIALSRDGHHLAMSRDSDIWIQSLRGGIASRFTFGPPPGWTTPVWSPDAKQIAYATSYVAAIPSYEIRIKARDMAGGEESLLRSDSILHLEDWSPDGKWLIYTSRGDLWLLPLEPRGEPVPFAKTPATEAFSRFSPDARWVAYRSDESGREEVFVQPFPATGAKWQVSLGGGSLPVWRRDGKELFFLASDLTLMSVPVKLGNRTLEHGAPRSLFETNLAPSIIGHHYDVAPDGERFLFRARATGQKPPPITVVLNWQAGLKD